MNECSLILSGAHLGIKVLDLRSHQDLCSPVRPSWRVTRLTASFYHPVVFQGRPGISWGVRLKICRGMGPEPSRSKETSDLSPESYLCYHPQFWECLWPKAVTSDFLLKGTGGNQEVPCEELIQCSSESPRQMCIPAPSANFEILHKLYPGVLHPYFVCSVRKMSYDVKCALQIPVVEWKLKGSL